MKMEKLFMKLIMVKKTSEEDNSDDELSEQSI